MAKVSFMYLSVNGGRITAAIELPDHSDQIRFSLAFSAPQDRFTRSMGRTLTLSRLGDPDPAAIYRYPLTISPRSSGETVKSQVFKAILELLSTPHKSIPSWAFGANIIG